MDDVTDTVFRQIIATLPYPSHRANRVTDSVGGRAGALRRYGPDLFFTEFVNVDALQSPGREAALKRLKFTDKERPIIAQIWGKNPENFYKTAKQLVDMGFDGIDLNFGCPERKVIKNGLCIAMINNRELAGEIIQAAKEGGSSLPISVKTRLGLNEVDYSWHEFLLKHKLNMLTIHGRTAKQLSKVPADWDAIAHVRSLRDSLFPATLIVGNGDVLSRIEGEQLAKQHKLDGIMIGRGVFHDPFVFSKTSPWVGYSKKQRVELYTKHVKLFAKTWAEGERPIYTLNKFCKIYINGFDGAKELREGLMQANSASELLNKLEDIC